MLTPDKRTPFPRRGGGQLARLSGMQCQAPQFHGWVSGRADYRGPVPVTADSAAEYVRQVCGVSSRADLDHNREAARRFHALIRRPFLEYVQRREGLGQTFMGYRVTAQGIQAAYAHVSTFVQAISEAELGEVLLPYLIPVDPWEGVSRLDAAGAAARQVLFDLTRQGKVRSIGRGLVGERLWRSV